MDNTSQQLLQGAAGVGGGAAKYVDEVFDIRFYKGDGQSSRKILNNINLEEEGGTVWIKATESDVQSWTVVDTERGATKVLNFTNGSGESTDTTAVKEFHSDGFTIGNNASVNNSSNNYQAITFRRAPKFFDVVKWTGNGTSGHQIPHILETVPKFVIVRRYDGAEDWTCYQANMTTPNQSMIQLNAAGVRQSGGNANYWGEEPNSGAADFSFTDTHFSVGTHGRTNSGSGWNYVAYLFASDAGGFGEDGTESIIKTNSYAGNNGNHLINCGWESQFNFVKCWSNTSTDWRMYNSILGYSEPTAQQGAADARCLRMNTNNASGQTEDIRILSDPRGFQYWSESNTQVNANSRNYLYLAVRAPTGPVANPYTNLSGVTRGKQFMAIATGNGQSNTPPGSYSTVATGVVNWPVSFAYHRATTGTDDTNTQARQTRRWQYKTNETAAASQHGHTEQFRSTSGWKNGQGSGQISWMWKQGPGHTSGFYQGAGGNLTLYHALGVPPEMIWIKNMDRTDWNPVGHAGANNGVNPWNYGSNGMQSAAAFGSGSYFWNNTAPTATQFTVGNNEAINYGGDTFMYGMWASVAGLSKCGHYLGNGVGGNNNSITCGFSPRYLMIKQASGGGPFIYWDTFRGAYANRLNDTTAPQANSWVNFTSTGFTLDTTGSDANGNNEKYVYYAHV